MRRVAMGLLAVTVILGLTAPLALAYDCPLLVKECRVLVARMEKRGDTDKTKVAAAKQGCEDSLRFHEAGKHKESVIEAGLAISLAASAVK